MDPMQPLSAGARRLLVMQVIPRSMLLSDVEATSLIGTSSSRTCMTLTVGSTVWLTFTEQATGGDLCYTLVALGIWELTLTFLMYQAF